MLPRLGQRRQENEQKTHKRPLLKAWGPHALLCHLTNLCWSDRVGSCRAMCVISATSLEPNPK